MPDIEKPFKERVRDVAIACAPIYKAEFVDLEYFVYASGLTPIPHCILYAHEDNYAHLTGVHNIISAQAFFDQCMDGTLSVNNFDFCKYNQNENSVKGSCRKKILCLPNLSGLFKRGLKIERNLVRRTFSCVLATSDGVLTLGFVVMPENIPLPNTLLRSDELTPAAVPVELVLSRKSGTALFDVVEQGDITILNGKGLNDYLSDELIDIIAVQSNPPVKVNEAADELEDAKELCEI